MLFKEDGHKVSYKENMRGGNGTIMFSELIPQGLLNEKGRLFSRIIIEPGCSIGFHTHEGEYEIYYVLEGELIYNENNEKEYVIAKGDCTFNPAGTGHGVKNNSNKRAVVIAVILFE
jgi:quercetin dioxygenase-like cupin family protein